MRRTQPVADHDGVSVVGPQFGLAGLQHRPPVAGGSLGEARRLKTPARPQQHWMALGGPQHPAHGRLQPRRAVAQCLLERGGDGSAGPCLEQRLGGGARCLVALGRGEVLQHRGLDHAVHPHRAGGARGVDAEQARPGQVEQNGARLHLVHRGTTAVAAQVGARGLAGEHRPWDAVGVQHRNQGQGRPGQPGRRDLLGELGGQCPGGGDDRRVCARSTASQALHAVGDTSPVLTAVQPRVGHQRGRLGQRDRQVAKVTGQVEGADPLVRVGVELAGQVGEGLAGAERSHLDGARPICPHRGVGTPAGDHHASLWPMRPEPLKRRSVAQVVEDHQPPAAGLGEPVKEVRRCRFRRVCAGPAHVLHGLGVAGDDGVPAGRGQPENKIQRMAVPERVCDREGQLRFAGAAEPAQGPVRLIGRDQYGGVPRRQGGGQAEPGLLPGHIRIRQLRDQPRQQRPSHLARTCRNATGVPTVHCCLVTNPHAFRRGFPGDVNQTSRWLYTPISDHGTKTETVLRARDGASDCIFRNYNKLVVVVNT